MGMPGRKYLATSSSKYRYSINGQEKESELNENITTALYWEYDSRILRRWNTDPVNFLGESPYLVNGGNPIYYTDPLGDFKTKFGALWYRFWNDGDKIGKNKFGEWYVSKKVIYEDGAKGNGKDLLSEVKIGVEKYYGSGRKYYSAAAQELAETEGIKVDIFINGEKSRYQIYGSDREAGLAALGYIGLAIPSPILKSGTITSNSTKVVSETNSQLLLESQGMRLLRIAENPKLKELVSKLWRPGAKLGDGSTGAIIKLEKAEGVITSVSGSHVQKAEEAIATCRKLLKGNFGTLSETDGKVVFEIIENLTSGTGLKW